ncbi:FAD binding domain-containing protein [Apiospora hydei]|uniref:FAD binding domain-containing protein n=1 Tax=Apiospora hydei TaxID=1337664 RepID=A0ABR1XDT7_9PEZI
MTSPATEEVDLVIVGGGPTGLLCAVLARRLGLSVSVIDEKPSTLPAGRADGLNARTQQYLQIAKVLYDLQPKGVKCNTSSTFANGEFQSRQSSWWTSLEHCLEKNMLIVGQPEIEKVLLQKLRTEHSTAAAYLRFDHRATSISEDADGVTVKSEQVTAGDGDSNGVTTRAKYAIGADGARSTVRQALDIGFEGTEPEMVWAALDTVLDTDFPVCPEIVSLQLAGQCRVLWIPRERGMARFYIRLPEEEEEEEEEGGARDHARGGRGDDSAAYGAVPGRVCADGVVWDVRRGRVFLAGDAAHCHSVNGAQGLNTGIADAFGLIWRIALAYPKMKPMSSPERPRRERL